MSSLLCCRQSYAMPWLMAGALLMLSSATAFSQTDAEIVAEIDRLLERSWADNGIKPSPLAKDGEFARRASLDVVGHIPSLETLLGVLQDDSENRRSQLVDRLLEDGDYARNWTNIWGNLLIGRANRRNAGARGDLDRWLNAAFTRNLSYDKFVSELVSATGSSEDDGAIGFLASHLNDNATPATAITARLFLGLQVQCTQCHNHPFNDWKQSQFWGLNAFFRGTQRQNVGTAIYLSDGTGIDVVFFEKRSGTMEAITRQFVDGTPPPESIGGSRHQLAALMVNPAQPYLCRAIVNRMWAHYLGEGFTRPIDDMGPHNPPSNPELVDYLANQFRASGHDLKRLTRWIMASTAYQRTSSATADNVLDDPASGSPALFSRCYVKPFTAEQLYDSLLIATSAHQAGRNFEQAESKRREWLQQFVQAFGTDENDESDTFNGTVPQALVLMNGDLMRNALGGGQGSFLRTVYDGRLPALATVAAKNKDLKLASPRSVPGRIEALYLTALCRKPSPGELQTLNTAYARAGGKDPVAGLQDVFWAILNSNEFILNH